MARTKQSAKNVAYIYKIEGNNKTYIGQSKEKYFSTRKKNHKAQFKRWLNGDKKYCSFLGSWDINRPPNNPNMCSYCKKT